MANHGGFSKKMNESKKSILIVVNTLESGGIGKYVQKILPSLSLIYDISILSRDVINEKTIKKFKISKVHNLKVPKFLDIWPFKEIIFFLYGFLFFSKYFKEDIILLNYPFFIPQKFRNKCKIISIVHATHSQYVKAKTPKKLIFFILKFLHLLLTPLDYYRFRVSEKIIFVSMSGFSSIKLTNKQYIPNPLDKKVFWKNKKVKEELNVVFIARNDPYKGVDFLEKVLKYLFIDNYSTYKHIKFYIIGLDKLNKSYRNTSVLGRLTFNETERILNSMHIFFSPSYLENTPNVVLEAISHSIIPLVSNVGDCRKILGKDLVFNSNDFENFIEKFNDLILNYKKNPPYLYVNKINLQYSLHLVENKLKGVLNNE